MNKSIAAVFRKFAKVAVNTS